MGHLNQPPGVIETAADRRVRALELRKSGMPYRAIATALGVNVKTAHRDVKRSLSRLAKMEQTNAEELRTLETERLDMAMRAIAVKVAKGELQAIDRWLRLCESRRRLLGLDAQQAVDGLTNNSFTVVIATAQPPARKVDMIDAETPHVIGERLQAPALPLIGRGDREHAD